MTKLFDTILMKGARHCVTDRCVAEDCERITTMPFAATGAPVRVCTTYIKPSNWFRHGKVCPMIFKDEVVEQRRVRIGQQKQKRRKK